MRAALTRIGPRPALLARYLVHQIASRLHRRWVARRYQALVADGHPLARLVAPEPGLVAFELLPPILREAAEAIRAEADMALTRTVDLLGSGPRALGDIDWHCDFKSGYRWPVDFYQDIQVTRLDDDSDAKVPWELSRGHQLLALARAASLFEEERYAQEFERQLADWITANPPGFGINWVNAMEVAIRAVNWIWAIATLERWRPLSSALRENVTRSLQAHGRHIWHNLEGTPYLRSNHYLCDILGLLVLGSALEGDRAAHRWQRRAVKEFEREIRTQVLPDGVGFEASLGYHGLALEVFAIARWVAAMRGMDFSAGYDERLRRMIDVSRSVRHGDGRIPAFGDGDSGRILPVDRSRPLSHDAQMWLGAAATGSDAPTDGAPDAHVAWTFGVETWVRSSQRPVASPAPSQFPDGGIYVLDGGGTHIVVRCGDVGQNGNGGHAHNDMLSFELSRDHPVIVDSGTYVYTSDPDARNAFRSSAAHNVIVVDGEETNPFDPSELFRMRQTAMREASEYCIGPGAARFAGSHDGYARLPCATIHRRAITLDRTSGAVVISDSLTGRGGCSAASYLHVAPRPHVELLGYRTFALTLGDERLVGTFTGDVESLDVVDGWVSDRYGRREPALVLITRISGTQPLATRLELHAEQIESSRTSSSGAVAHA